MEMNKVYDAFELPAVLVVLVVIARVLLSGGLTRAPDRAQAPAPAQEPPAACREVPDEAPPTSDGVSIVEYEGHEYLCVRVCNQLGIIHSATCRKCNDNGKEKRACP